MGYTEADLSPISRREGSGKGAIGVCEGDFLEAFWCSDYLSDPWWEPSEGVEVTFPRKLRPDTRLACRPWSFPRSKSGSVFSRIVLTLSPSSKLEDMAWPWKN